MNRKITLFLFCGTSVIAQVNGTSTIKAVRNLPFTAQTKTETIQALPDSGRVVRTTEAVLTRDSEGRTRREQTGTGIVFLHDPVLGLAWVIDTHAETARQYVIPAAVENQKRDSSPQTEPLDTTVIEGLTTSGSRLIRDLPAGEAGNDRPIRVTSEAWYSAELQLVLSSHTLDPRTGETTYNVTGIVRAEPDRALFQVPAGYRIQSPAGK